MPKKCIKFIPEYLIPSLNNGRFGDRLRWIDKNKKIFEIYWCHKAGPQWSEQEAAVFVEWDKYKGHYQPENRQYYTQSKQRFRALLYKFTQVGQLIELPSETKFKKVFCIGEKKSRKKKTDSSAGCESCTEEMSSESEDFDCERFLNLDNSKVSENDTLDILKDHTYSCFGIFQHSLTGVQTSDAENEDVVLNNSQNMWSPSLPSESPLDNLQKRVLVERNYENTMIPATNFFTEGSPLLDFPRDYSQSFQISVPAVYQNAVFAGNIPEVSNLQANVESWNFCQIPDLIDASILIQDEKKLSGQSN